MQIHVCENLFCEKTRILSLSLSVVLYKYTICQHSCMLI